MDPTQTRRDNINLTRLIRRLEKAVNAQKWDDSPADDIWIKSLETLQVCHCIEFELFTFKRSPIDCKVYKEIVEKRRTS